MSAISALIPGESKRAGREFLIFSIYFYVRLRDIVPLLILLSNTAKSIWPICHLVKTAWQSYLHLLGWSAASLRVLGSAFLKLLPLETSSTDLRHICGFSACLTYCEDCGSPPVCCLYSLMPRSHSHPPAGPGMRVYKTKGTKPGLVLSIFPAVNYPERFVEVHLRRKLFIL